MHRLATKWLFSLLAVMVIGLALLGSAAYLVTLNHYRAYIESTLTERANAYAEVLSRNPDQKIWALVVELEKQPEIGMFLFSSTGDLLFSSNDSKADLEEARKWSREHPSGVRKINAGSTAKERILVKSWIRQEGEIVGSVIMMAKPPGLEATKHSLQSMLMLAGVGALLVASSVSLILSQRLVHPILQIRQAAEQIARGQYQVRVDVLGKDELASLGERMNQLADSLAYYRSSRREFLSDVAHELRTPLTYLKGYAALLQRKGLDEKNTRKLIGIIRDQADRLDRLVGDIVTLSRLDEGQLKLSLQRVEVEPLLTKVVDEMRPRAEELGLRLRFEQSGEKMYCLLDPDRFHQILMNLIDNAFRFSHQGGEVVVSITRQYDRLQISVADEGIGMLEEELERIWERFYRVEKSRSRRHGGSGLGLSIVKQLTQLQRGTIEVESLIHQGTVFFLRFPIHSPALKEGKGQ